MKILSISPEAFAEVPFLNAGRGRGSFFEDVLPVHEAVVDQLPTGIDAILATADLQGRQFQRRGSARPPVLLGEFVPKLLAERILPGMQLHQPKRIGVILAGDFYTVPNLDKRGGTGDVSNVWEAFGDYYAGGIGVAGNHDAFAEDQTIGPRFPSHICYLDGDTSCWNGLTVGGLGGVIGNPERYRRRDEDDYLEQLMSVLEGGLDVLVLHDGPRGNDNHQPGSATARTLIEEYDPLLVIRGHRAWQPPLALLKNGTQVLNVHQRIVVLRQAHESS